MGVASRWKSLGLVGIVVLCCCGPRTDAAAAFHAGDFEASAKLLEVRAKLGDVDAQNYLGVMYYIGVGVPRDYAQAVHWFERAALKGEPHAQRHLASMFRQGQGLVKDDFRAFGWYDAARKSGHTSALDYMRWCTLTVGPNQQALGQRIVAQDLKRGVVSHAEPK